MKIKLKIFTFVFVQITDLINDKKYIQITKNVCRSHHLTKDLHAEAILIILEKKVDLKTIRNLEHFFSTIVWFTWHSNKFKKKYLNQNLQFFEEYDYEIEDEENYTEQIDFSVAYEFIDTNPKTEIEYYEINLFKIYLELGSIQKVSRKTKIPYQTVFFDIKEIKNKLKLAYDQNRNKVQP